MRTPVRRSTLVLAPLLAVLALASCVGTDDPVAPLPGEGLRFSYSGALSGSYRSAGEASLGSDGLPRFGEWAVARPDSLGGIVVAGLEPTGDRRGNLFILQLRGKTTGEYECAFLGAGGRTCYGTFLVGIDLSDPGSPPEARYFVDAGKVTLTGLTPTRVQGSFAIGLRDFDHPDRTLTVTDGRIDVPYRNEQAMFNGLRCLIASLQGGSC